MLLSLLLLGILNSNTHICPPKFKESIFFSESRQAKNKIASVFIEYDDMTNAVFSRITYYPKKIYVTSDGFHIANKKIENKDIINILQSYLMQFFVDRTEKIELSRTKTEGPITGEYSTIKITLYFKNEETEVFSSTIGSEDYIIEYNPKFNSFLKLIEELVQ